MIATRQWLMLALVAVMEGCSGSSESMMDDDPYADGGSDFGSDGYDEGASSSGVDDDGFMSGGAFDDPTAPGGPLEIRVIYFEFDKADINADSRDLLGEHGLYMADNPNLGIRLEGHGDERGSREYNIGLGERRAQAVRQILLLNGATAAQLSTVSYGEERPAALGSDEEAWSLNRRVEIVYNP